MADIWTSAGHHLTGSAAHTGIEHAVLAANDVTLTSATAGFTTTVSSLWTGFGVGLSAIASAIINVIKYKNMRSDIRELYQDEIASKLSKSPKQVTNQDMDALAAGIPERGIPANTILAEELDKLKKDRNLGILVTTVSILCSIPIALTLAAPIISAIGASSMTPFFQTAVTLLTKAAMGFVCHRIMEYPVEAIGQKLFDMETTSTHERIANLVNEHEAGKALSKEQVLGVFISTNQQLDGFVTQNFGNTYDKLKLEVQQAIAQSFEQFIPLSDVVDSLNSGRVKITELAFSAIGQQSGVKPSDNPVAPKVNVIGKARGVFYDVASRFKLRQPLQKLPEVQQIQSANGQPQIQAYSPPVRPQYKPMYYEQNERADKKQWAQMVKPQSVTPTNEPAVSGGRG